MPPNASAPRSKRSLSKVGSTDDTEPSAAKSKKVAPDDEAAAAAESGDNEADWEDVPGYRVTLGPNGEILIPSILPEECAKSIPKIPIPGSWIRGLDGTPGRVMTLASRRWWETNSPWLIANRTKLGIKPSDWAKRGEAMLKEVELKEDEGKNDWDFICLPKHEDRDGDDDDEDDDDDDDDEDEEADGEDDDENEGEAANRNSKRKGKGKDKKRPDEASPVGKLASLHPGYPYIASMRAHDRYQWWLLEVLKRDQDDFSLHIYNDFSLYGQLEVLENIFLQFSKVFKPTADVRNVWPEVEGLALILDMGVIDFTMVEDGDRGGRTIEMIGNMTVACMDYLVQHELFSPASSVPNIGYILSLIIKWSWDQTQDEEGNSWEDNGSWIYYVVKTAEDAGISLTDASRMDEILEKAKARSIPESSLTKWRNIKWASKLKSFRSRYGSIGGQSHDITKMSAARRKQHSYDSDSFY
ncbi:hypothetical protein BGZ63DRAFT_426032 [Mariannaea sp. PMI_226]|nr:hypothetical protein BGZ63DRAFT_426032 [Mariannaea sp. PMI_226]